MSSDGSRVTAARTVLLTAGAAQLDRRPWQHSNEAPDDASLVRFALWRNAAQIGAADTAELEAGLSLLAAARSDLEALEAALVFTARAEGLTWARIAAAMGLRSPQAAQQRFQRNLERPGADTGSTFGGDDDRPA